jgi:DNA-nicking Smr family endonuclease
VDFGEILNTWEKRNDGAVFIDKDALLPPGNAGFTGGRRSRLLRKKPDAVIDLHGLNRDEAWTTLEAFFEDSRRKGFEKVLVIHGKGSHRGSRPARYAGDAESEGVLRDLTRRFVESCSWAGESGYSTVREGGTGSTWVIIKEEN